jgi:hypothetical protein
MEITYDAINGGMIVETFYKRLNLFLYIHNPDPITHLTVLKINFPEDILKVSP